MDAYTYLHFTDAYNAPSQPKANVLPKVTPKVAPQIATKMPLKAIAKELPVQPPASAPKTDYYLMPVMF